MLKINLGSSIKFFSLKTISKIYMWEGLCSYQCYEAYNSITDLRKLVATRSTNCSPSRKSLSLNSFVLDFYWNYHISTCGSSSWRGEQQLRHSITLKREPMCRFLFSLILYIIFIFDNRKRLKIWCLPYRAILKISLICYKMSYLRVLLSIENKRYGILL
mgnify:CR=1 FL=1